MLSRDQKSRLKYLFIKHQVLVAYLFGSRATGEHNKNSDYDFAVFFNTTIKPLDRFKKRLLLIEKVGRIIGTDKIDLVVLNDITSLLFKFCIIKEGILIYQKNINQTLDIELKITGEYHDFLPTLEQQRIDFIKSS